MVGRHLNAAQAAEILIALLLPFCNQVGIRNFLLDIVGSDLSDKLLAHRKAIH